MSFVTLFYISLVIITAMLSLRIYELKKEKKIFATLRLKVDILTHYVLRVLYYFIFVWLTRHIKKGIQIAHHAIVESILTVRHFITHWWNKFEHKLIATSPAKHRHGVSFFWKTMAEYKQKDVQETTEDKKE